MSRRKIKIHSWDNVVKRSFVFCVLLSCHGRQDSKIVSLASNIITNQGDPVYSFLINIDIYFSDVYNHFYKSIFSII